MKANRLQAYGGVEQFRFEETPDPVPGAGEVLIRVAQAFDDRQLADAHTALAAHPAGKPAPAHG